MKRRSANNTQTSPRNFRADDLVAYFLRAGEAIHELFRYDREATGVLTVVDEAVELRSGVCQDFAVSPVRGVYKGASQGLFSVNVAVEAPTTTQ